MFVCAISAESVGTQGGNERRLPNLGRPWCWLNGLLVHPPVSRKAHCVLKRPGQRPGLHSPSVARHGTGSRRGGTGVQDALSKVRSPGIEHGTGIHKPGTERLLRWQAFPRMMGTPSGCTSVAKCLGRANLPAVFPSASQPPGFFLPASETPRRHSTGGQNSCKIA